jgi:hypothetical protein
MQIKRDDDFRNALIEVLKTSDGKKVIFGLLEKAGIYRESYSDQAGLMAYLAGQQSVGRWMIMKLSEIDPRTYPRLMFEIEDIRAMEREAKKKGETE